MLAGWLTKASVNVQLLADSLNPLALNMREEWPDGHFSWFKHFFSTHSTPVLHECIPSVYLIFPLHSCGVDQHKRFDIPTVANLQQKFELMGQIMTPRSETE